MPEQLLAGRYELVEPLGRGGMSEVWSATDRVLDRPVAVKLMLPSAAEAEGATVRFSREARAAARLTHPGAVSVYDFGTDGDRLFLVMELVTGPTVAELIREHPRLPVARAVDLAAQAATALAAAHAAGVVHRDVKPGNLLLAEDGTLKIADFGIARFTDQATRALTGTSAVIGTVAYLSPEQVSGGEVSAASDLYALGCVLYELLCGRPPFTSEQPARVLYQHAHEDPLPPGRLREDLPAELEGLILGLLAKDPAARPADAAAVGVSLRSVAALLEGGGAATPTGSAEPDPVSGATATFPAQPEGTRVLQPGSGRRRMPMFLAAAGVLALIVAGAVFLAGGRPGDRVDPAANASAPGQTSDTPAAPADRGRDSQSSPPDSDRDTRSGNDGPPDRGPGQGPSAKRLISRLEQHLDVRSDRIDEKVRDRIEDRLDQVLDKVEDGKPREAGKKVDDLRKKLRKATEKGEWEPDTRTRRLLSRLDAELPDAH